MTKEELIRCYEEAAARYAMMALSLKKRGRMLVMIEIVAVLLAFGLVIAFCSNALGRWALFTSIAAIVIYFFARHIDIQNDSKLREVQMFRASGAQ